MESSRNSKRRKRDRKVKLDKTADQLSSEKGSTLAEFEAYKENESSDKCVSQNAENEDYHYGYHEDYEDTFNYGDGVEPETVDILKYKIFGLILAISKAGEFSHDAQHYLVTILSVCSIYQRKELMKVRESIYNPLTLACKLRNLDLVKFFVEHCESDVNGDSCRGRPLLCAVTNGDEDIVHYLLECNADINIHYAPNYNLLMLALKLFPEEKFGTFGYEAIRDFKQHEEDKKDKKKLFNQMIHKTEIVKMLVDKGAIEKCTKAQIFYILISMFDKELCIPNSSQKILLDKIPDFGNIRNTDGMTILGNEMIHRSSYMSEFLKPYLENVNNINTANVLRFYFVSESSDSIENNVDAVLKSFIIDRETNEACTCKDSHKEHPIYVHLLVYLACNGRFSWYLKILEMPEIPFEAKLNSLEMLGTYCHDHRQSMYAIRCWNSANQIRQLRCLRMTRNRMYHTRIHVYPKNTSIFERGNIEENIVPGAPNGNPLSKYFEESVDKAIHIVNQCYENLVRQDKVPNLTVNSPKCTFVSLLENHMKEAEEDFMLHTDMLLMLRNASFYQCLIGFGDFSTFRAFKCLADELYKRERTQAYVAMVTYSFPYFVKHLPNEESLSIFDKKLYLSKIISRLIKIVVNKSSQLTFDLLMAIWKCCFLECCVTPRNQRKFLEFASLLVMMKIMARRNKTAQESGRFSEFMRNVMKADLRNLYGQTLLYYTVPTLSKDTVDTWMSYEKSPLICNFSGSVEMIKLLLAFGADPNAYDDMGKTPLHFCFMLMYDDIENEEDGIGVNSPEEVVQTLLQGGAHPDSVDYSNSTPIEISEISEFPLCQVSNRTLQCLASNVIVNNKVKFHDHLPQHLVQFVKMHKKKGKPTAMRFPEHFFGFSSVFWA
ncbi:unnamed protein product [Mytilus coruscus]|uniref:Ankyrin repeat domain-containing protein 54 n=1 Tax=Mytilus coruscus TaxID=42192 RepID=A0A6J8DYZ1_MYTCO|nr:unnamed protein product [Mytilus coruscus]